MRMINFMSYFNFLGLIIAAAMGDVTITAAMVVCLNIWCAAAIIVKKLEWPA